MAEVSASSPLVPNPPSVTEEEPKQVDQVIEDREVKTEPVQVIKEMKEEEEEEEHFQDKIDNEQLKKFKKFEADFRQHLMAKYFSEKNVFGGNIFDVKVNIDGQTATASRLPPYQSYLNPATFPETLRKDPNSSAEASMNGNSE